MHNKVYTVIGAKGEGKTPFITGGKFEKGMALNWKEQRGMSSLIVDELDHPSYRQFQILHPKDYRLLSDTNQIYRTLCSLQDMDELRKKIAFDKLVWNTLLVWEDAGKHFPMNLSKVELTMIGNCKQQNVDLVFMFWSWSEVPTKILKHSNYLVIFNTADTPDYRADCIGGCLDAAMEAHRLVRAKKAPNGLPYIIVPTGV